jgi:RNA polymerase primary sigma factor
MEQNPQSQLKLLVQRGKEQGYLTYAEVNDHLPEDIVDSDQIEDIIQMINDMGIQVMEEAPDADDLLLAETSNNGRRCGRSCCQVLSSVESEIGRTTDPVRMYMREMGTVELLTREGEIDIAKRIEDGINQVQCSVAEYPEAITYLLEQYDRVEAEEARLSDLITGLSIRTLKKTWRQPRLTSVLNCLRKRWMTTKTKMKKTTTTTAMTTTASTLSWRVRSSLSCVPSTK